MILDFAKTLSPDPKQATSGSVWTALGLLRGVMSVGCRYRDAERELDGLALQQVTTRQAPILWSPMPTKTPFTIRFGFGGV
jgi:hypothetical protein